MADLEADVPDLWEGVGGGYLPLRVYGLGACGSGSADSINI